MFKKIIRSIRVIRGFKKKDMKIHITLIFLLLTLCATPALAQFKFGVTAGLNISKFTVSDSDYKSYIDKIRPGFFVGPTVIFDIPKTGVGVDASSLFDMRGARSKSYSNTETVRCYSFQFPVNIRYGYSFGDWVYGFIFTGPQIGLSIGNRNHYIIPVIDKSTGHTFERRWTDETSSFSWNFGIGGVVLEKVQVRISYNLALRKTGEIQLANPANGKSRTLADGKAHACQVALSYLF